MGTVAIAIDDRDRLPPPVFPFKMGISVLEVGKTEGVVLETVGDRPLQDPGRDLPRGEKPLGFPALVSRVSRETLEVSFCEQLPRLELEESANRGPELFYRLLVLPLASPCRDKLPWDEGEPVGDDLPAREDVKNEELLVGRVDLDHLVPVLRGKLVTAGLDRDHGLFVGCPFFPSEKRVLPENRVPERPQMGSFLFDENGRDLPRRLGDLTVGPSRQPAEDPDISLLHSLKVPGREEVPFGELHQVLDLALRLGVGPPADPEPEPLLVDEVLEVLGTDDVPGVLARHHQPVLVDHQLLGPAAKIVERVKKQADDVKRPEGLPLEYHVLVAAGRKKRGKDIKPKTARAAVLTKIELHLLAERQFRHLRVETRCLVQSQAVRPDEVADEVPEALFVSRKGAVLFLQIIVDRGDLEPPEAIGLVDLEDLLPVTVEDLVPVKLILAVGPPGLFLHSEVLGDRLGVEL